ncbi:MAG: hypothetical protein IJ033_00605 [Clostridia bacterium]|nr:hypothetical protein [Clostridia bacterium]
MRKQKKAAKIKDLIVKNLTYVYLKANLDAIEKEMSENEPVQIENSKNIITKVISSIACEVANGIRRKNTIELSAAKSEAIQALTAFEKSVSSKDIELAKDSEKLKAFINKKMFKHDKNNLMRMQFALSFALNMVSKDSAWEDGLNAVSNVLFDDEGMMYELYKKYENNFYGIQKKSVDEVGYGMILGLGVWSLNAWSLIPIGIGGLAALVQHVMHKRDLKKAFENLSKDELHAYLSMKLTLIEESKGVMDEENWKTLVDEALKYLSNLRSDSEYEWLIEKQSAQTNKAKIELCNLTIDRISKIVGI